MKANFKLSALMILPLVASTCFYTPSSHGAAALCYTLYKAFQSDSEKARLGIKVMGIAGAASVGGAVGTVAGLISQAGRVEQGVSLGLRLAGLATTLSAGLLVVGVIVLTDGQDQEVRFRPLDEKTAKNMMLTATEAEAFNKNVDATNAIQSEID